MADVKKVKAVKSVKAKKPTLKDYRLRQKKEKLARLEKETAAVKAEIKAISGK